MLKIMSLIQTWEENKNTLSLLFEKWNENGEYHIILYTNYKLQVKWRLDLRWKWWC